MVNKENLEWGENYDGKKHSLGFNCLNENCSRSDLRKTDYPSVDYFISMAIGIKKKS
jgi:hypothetical protein